MRGGRFIGAMGLCLCLVTGAAAQDSSLAELRADLAELAAELDALRAEVSTPDHAGLSETEAGGVQVRLDSLAESLRQMTGRIEAAEHRVMRIAEDGARRIRDAEFRITTLEGGDTSSLSGTPSPLGTTPPVVAVRGEQQDFIAARAAFDNGDMAEAARLMGEFIASYPDGPSAGEARLYQGRAFAAMGEHQEAARVFLKGFSGAPDAPSAPHALLGLAMSLDHLGQHDQACLTLAEILFRYPSMPTELAQDVTAQKAELGCE